MAKINEDSGGAAAAAVEVVRDSHRLFGHAKSVAMIANSQAHCSNIEKVLRKATLMRREGAFIHHYEKFGVDREMFDEAFINCENALAEYKAL